MLSTPATIAFFVFAILLAWGVFLTNSLPEIPTARRNAALNLATMVVFFVIAVFALWAISHGWGATRPERLLYAFLLAIFGLGFTVPFLSQLSLWARCKAMASAPAALRAVR